MYQNSLYTNIFSKRVDFFVSLAYNILAVKRIYRGVEQLVARRAHNPEAVGSSPTSATKKPLIPFRVSKVFLCLQSMILIYILRVMRPTSGARWVRLRPPPVAGKGSKTKRSGQKLPALQADSNFWAPQEAQSDNPEAPTYWRSQL